MSWLLTVGGFAALIVLHEFGHFAVAKAVGMRVERFALFFPPLLVKVRRGETEYGIGAVPLGGYVRISGMNPHEELSPEVQPRAYYRQPPWKRIVVIAAGPAMNVLVAFLILWILFWANGLTKPTSRVSSQALRAPASQILQPGDRIVAIDGHGGSVETIRDAIGRHRCAGPQRQGCLAATPARVTVRRDGQLRTFSVRPRYDAGARRVLLGFSFATTTTPVGPVRAAHLGLDDMWRITRGTVSAVARIFDPEQRKQISGVVGTSETLQQTFRYDVTQAMVVLAIISLSLAIVNLFPFLPLDGGHIFWAVAEKVRGRAIPFSVMERAGVVGFLLVIMLFVIGLTNDIDRLRGEGFSPR
jgi:regulator of sigma E protease